ncbi:MAG: hypothetical protein LBU27_03415 [Candidatus Peribacteria bacterium]|nr:hypothetical protein [Candidatus Peribacteria bacterium]
MVEKTIDFADDNQSKANYTVLRDDYLSIMEECKSLLKGDFWQFPDVHLRDTRKESQNATTTEFLRFVQNENLPIFSPEERREISNRITNTLEIFHSHHFYHRDLGQNPRNLIIKRDNGKVIPYIIDFGVAIEDKRYEE